MTFAESLEGAMKWWQDIQEAVDTKTIIMAIVGNKSDLSHEIKVSLEEAMKVKKETNAQICMEVSAKENTNMDLLFQNLAARLVRQEI
mmetsp:Transcript_104693/g.144802  ORF Transcript_104693/g.144802 Transcript_104693/m.144802 type:complete len:88 (+) Transcript_104693:306-569(+)